MMTAVFGGARTSAPTLTPIGNMTDASGGGLVAAFDGGLVRSYPSAATSAPGTDAIIGFTYGFSRTVYAFIALSPIDDNFCGAGGSRAAFFEGSNDGSSWTTLWTGTYSSGYGANIMGIGLPATAYLNHRLRLTGDGSSRMRVAQLVPQFS